MLENLKKYAVVLASNSPRRKELLGRLGVPFTVRTLLGIDERVPRDTPVAQVAEMVARKKAEGYRTSIKEGELIVCADTVVALGEQVMGKPKSVDEAKDMLRTLSGKWHSVWTGVSVFTTDKEVSFTAHSRVKFAELESDEIDFYVDNYVPLDKAGAYGIQDWIGIVAVEEIEGSYFNVVGLPMQRLYQALKSF